ncbi:MAG: hypothetical protein HF978_13475 [Desulfobacteraceae bacterium]|nr:OB-fold domain-containing protein [Desulfobacteraceae bacterium]MBC2756553.1 hypothetical protein [Desulfobacteraceae bacterium]
MEQTRIKLEENEMWVRENLLKLPETPDESPRLIAGKCESCGDVSFPQKERCGVCSCKNINQIYLSRTAKIYSYTIVHRSVPGYQLPNIVAMLKFKEDDSLLVISQIKNIAPEDVKSGMEVELIIDKLSDNFMTGKKVIGYAFQPTIGDIIRER